ncbi:MAG: cation diffusion facilitator family transporter [Chthoniobacteraceae bacterium]
MKERPLTHFALLSVAAAVVTFLLKLMAWRLTDSVGLLSDALESLANVAAAFIALASLAVAIRPEDEEHAFGHSKAEYFAAGLEGALILVAAVAIGWTAVDRFFSPRALTEPAAGLAVSVGASLINLVVARVLMKVGVRRRSVALEADARHLMTDVWTSAVVVLAVGLVAITGWWWLDPLLGLLLAFHIIATGVRLIRESLLGLMDSGLPAAELDAIRGVLAKFFAEGVQYHALRTRRAGALKFMSVHLLMPGAWTIAHGHDIAERLENDLRETVPGLIVFTHMEPEEDPVSWQDVALERKAVESAVSPSAVERGLH